MFKYVGVDSPANQVKPNKETVLTCQFLHNTIIYKFSYDV